MSPSMSDYIDEFLANYFRKYPNRILFGGWELTSYLRVDLGVYSKGKNDKGYYRTNCGYKKISNPL